MPLDSAGLDEDVKRSLGSFVEVRSFGLLFLICGIGVGELELAVPEDFEAVMEVGTGSEDLGSEARTGVIDFDELEALRGSVRYGGFNVGGVTTSEQEHGEQCKAAERTHTGLKRNRGGVTVRVLKGLGEDRFWAAPAKYRDSSAPLRCAQNDELLWAWAL